MKIKLTLPSLKKFIIARHNNSSTFGNIQSKYIGECIGGMPAIVLLQDRCEPVDPQQTNYLCSAATPHNGSIHGMCGHFAANSVLNDKGDTE